jgi:uncharacterized glyoxalase superfamily protein PhnB
MTPIRSNAVFHVSDIDRSMDFYANCPGFKIDFRFGDPGSYAGRSLENVRLHISSSYPYKNNTGHGNLYITADEVDSLYHELMEAEVEFYCSIGNREYGMRDFAIKDPDENQIGIGAVLHENA